MNHHIVFLDNEGIGPTIELPKLSFPHSWESYVYTRPEEVVERLKDATVALTCSVPLRAEHLRQLPKLRMISLALTGTDIVDIEYCLEHDIMVTNVPGYAANTVAEHSLAMIFTLMRRTASYNELMRMVHLGMTEPKNIYFDFRVRDIGGKKLGIVGNGSIARRLADLARAVGMQVYFYDREGEFKGDEFIPMQQLLAQSDVISLNCPLTDETRNLIGSKEIAQMKHDAIIVNTARGGIVNEAALIDALQNNLIGGAALDVLVDEPVRPNDPIFQLIKRDNFILNPHVAWSSEDAMQGLINQSVGNIVQFVSGEIPKSAIRKVFS